jgi:hypothetical protein
MLLLLFNKRVTIVDLNYLSTPNRDCQYSAPRNTNPRPRPPSGRPSGGANIRGIKNLQGSTRAPAGGG